MPKKTHPTVQRYKWLNEAETMDFLSKHGASKSDLKHALQEAKLTSGKDLRVQFSTDGQKEKLNSCQMWVSLHLAGASSPSFDFERFAVEACKFEGKKATNAAQTFRSAIQKLRPFSLDAILRRCQEAHFGHTPRPLVVTPTTPTVTDQHGARTISSMDADVTTSVKKPQRYPVYETLLDNPLISLGLREDAVKKLYATETGQPSVGLDHKLSEMVTDFRKRESSVRSQARVWNLFLIWSAKRYRQLWNEEGFLLADASSVYLFLLEFQELKIGLSGTEPSFQQYILGEETFELKPGRKSLKGGYAKNVLTAMAALQYNQMSLLNRPNFEKIRSNNTVQKWLKNLLASDTNLNETERRNVKMAIVLAEDPLKIKLRQVHWMIAANDAANVKLWAITMAQFAAIARLDDIKRWCLKHLHVYTYTMELPSVKLMDINVLFVTQYSSKGKKDGSLPNERALVRHRRWDLCPIFAIAVYFYHRFVLWNEAAIDLTDPAGEWMKWRVFRGSKTSTSKLDSATIRNQRVEMFKNTKTITYGNINHQDRKDGAIAARMSDIDKAAIDAQAGWNEDTASKYYDKYPRPTTAAKFGGFEDSKCYFLSRALADSETYCKLHPEARELFNSFFPFIGDDKVGEEVERMAFSNDCVEPLRVFQALHLIKTVFFQDLPFLHQKYPDLKLFNTGPLFRHRELFFNWKNYVFDVSKSAEIQSNEAGQRLDSMVVDSGHRFDEALAVLKCRMDSLEANLKEAFVEEVAKLIGKKRSHFQFTEQAPEEIEGENLLKTLRRLTDMDIKDLMKMWNKGFISEGMQFEGLKELERKRTQEKISYYVPSLRSTICKMKTIALFVESAIEHCGSFEAGIQYCEDIRADLKTGRKLASLNAFYEHLLNLKKGLNDEGPSDHPGGQN